jgi:ribonucleoside-diphosphate reductase alpha chain
MELFKSHVMKAQRLIDDLVDLEIEKVDRILDKIKTDPEPEDIKRVEKELWLKIRSKLILGRRTGLGITAEGDMLAALGLRYGSNEAISFSQIVHSTMATRSYMSSIDMAEERGAFTICDPSVETNPFLERVKSRMSLEYLVKWDKFGRRNIANLTIAPAGTVSLMTQTTSGVEPLFLPYYKRRYKVEDRSKATFIDESGDAWVEYIVIHPKFKKWYNVNWYKTSVELFDIDYHKEIEDYDEAELKRLFEMSPYYGATANDVDWRASVKMQGTIQQWVDHSISKTINLPNSATVEQVNDLYMLAWESGCKGVTVYRDGSRDGVLVSTDDLKIEDDDFDYMDAYKRPETLECDIYHKTALKQNWMVIVGLVNDRPYEIFAVRDVDNHVFPTKIDKGKITKVKSKTYMLEGYVGEKLYKIENIVKLMSDDEQTDTRKYSSMLRHRMHPRFIIDQIEEYATIASFDKVVQRVLRNYLTQDEFKSEKCPVCGTPLTMTEGCKKCLNCGYAKCG